MVCNFVQQAGGRVTIDSDEGRGTTVRLYLPRTAEAARFRCDGVVAGGVNH